MLECPKLMHNIHRFQLRNSMYVADIDIGEVIEVNPIIWEILPLCSNYNTQQILETLCGKFQEKDIIKELETLEDAEKDGLFFRTEIDSTWPDTLSSRRPKIFAPNEFLSDITYAAGGGNIADHNIIQALAKHADVFVLSDTRKVISEGVYGIPLNIGETDRLILHFLRYNYDGILLLDIRNRGNLLFFYTTDIPIIGRLHSPQGQNGELINSIFMQYAAMREFDAFMMPTLSVKQFYSQLVLDVEEHFYVIPNGVDSEHFKPMDKSLAKKRVAEILNDPRILQRPVVGFFSRFQPEKGAGIYLKVAELIPEAIFLIVAPELYDYSLRDFPDNVIFAGRQPREKLPLFINAFDIHCFPSMVGEEAFGNAVLEAMSCGVPPVIPRFAGLPEVVGDAGIVLDTEMFPYEIGSFAGYISPIKLSQAVQQLLNNEAERIRLGQKARQRALTYTWDATAKNILSTFSHLNLKKKLSRKTHFTTAFVPFLNPLKNELEYQSIVINTTQRGEKPLMLGFYRQILEEGLALSLLRRHTLHEVEAVLLQMCPDTAVEILQRVKGFVDALE